MRRGQTTLLVVVVLGAFTLLAGAAVAQEAAAAEAHLLRLSFTAGEELTYRVEMNGVGSVQVMGMAQQVAVNGTLDMALKVEEITEEGNYQILTSLDAANLGVTVDGQPVPLGQRLPGMRTVITPRGETLSLEMLNGPATGGQMEAQLGQLLAGENFKNLLKVQRMAAFPEEAVAAGADWSGSQAEDELAEGETPTVITTKYVCDQEFEGMSCARLQTESVIGMDALGEMAALLAMTGATNSTSTTWFDYTAGRTRATQERAQVTLDLKLPAAMTMGAGEMALFMEMFMESRSWLLAAAE